MNLTDIIARYSKRFTDKYSLSHDQQHALDATLHCHTPRYGEIQLQCPHCEQHQVQYPCCGHRHCHRCQNHLTTQWLERQTQKLLPLDYFMVTFTIPFELRALARKHPKTVYACLFRCAVSTLRDFALNDKKLGAEIAMTAVLHTHSRRLNYHPHVHIIVPGGCINKRNRLWKTMGGRYLFKNESLAKVFRARLLQALQSEKLVLPASIATQWVVDCAHVGKGLPALKYLSRYLYRGVIAEKNIIADDGQSVTFSYTDNTGKHRTRTLAGEDFLSLVFQHVLPKGFRRVRDYGFLHPNAKAILHLIQQVLCTQIPEPENRPRPDYRCHHCQSPMCITVFFPPAWRSG